MVESYELYYDQFHRHLVEINLIRFETLLLVILRDCVLGILFEAFIWASKETRKDGHIVYNYT